LFEGEIKGQTKVMVGAYTELLRLLKDEFEEEVLVWKRKFKLNEDGWEAVSPTVREMIRLNNSDEENESFLRAYVRSKERKEHVKACGKQQKPI